MDSLISQLQPPQQQVNSSLWNSFYQYFFIKRQDVFGRPKKPRNPLLKNHDRQQGCLHLSEMSPWGQGLFHCYSFLIGNKKSLAGCRATFLQQPRCVLERQLLKVCCCSLRFLQNQPEFNFKGSSIHSFSKPYDHSSKAFSSLLTPSHAQLKRPQASFCSHCVSLEIESSQYSETSAI